MVTLTKYALGHLDTRWMLPRLKLSSYPAANRPESDTAKAAGTEREKTQGWGCFMGIRNFVWDPATPRGMPSIPHPKTNPKGVSENFFSQVIRACEAFGFCDYFATDSRSPKPYVRQ